MTRKVKKHFIEIVLFFLPSLLLGQQAWAPYERQLWVRPISTHSEYNSAYLANNYAKYDDNVRIDAFNLALEYGITDRLTVDMTTGFGRLGKHKIFDRYYGLQQTPESPNKFGVLDSKLGIRYKIIDEFDSKYKWIPTIAVRVGGIKKGDYDRNPQSLGDGASGGETNLLIAKDFNFFGLGALGDIGYRKREKPVPDDFLYYGAFYKRFLESFFITLGGRGQIGQGGYAFADPRQEPPWNYVNTTNTFGTYYGVNVGDYWVTKYRPAWGRKETFHNMEIGLGFSDSFGNFYNIFYSKTYSGYNTANLQTIGFIVNIPFNL
jgi:hypothetical protein